MIFFNLCFFQNWSEDSKIFWGRKRSIEGVLRKQWGSLLEVGGLNESASFKRPLCDFDRESAWVVSVHSLLTLAFTLYGCTAAADGSWREKPPGFCIIGLNASPFLMKFIKDRDHDFVFLRYLLHFEAFCLTNVGKTRLFLVEVEFPSALSFFSLLTLLPLRMTKVSKFLCHPTFNLKFCKLS